MNWEIMVARAAPWMPIFSGMINMASSMMLVTAPIIMPIIGMRALPSDLIRLFMAMEKVIKSIPIIIMVM